MKKLDSKKTVKNIVASLKKVFCQSGFSRAVIALSGGIDSGLSCGLTVRALGKNNVFPILLPYGQLNLPGLADALKLIDLLGIPKKNVVKIDIKSYVDEIIKIDPQMDHVRKGNVMARVRMIFIFDQAKKRKALVVGTENKSEHLLGYFTRFGDEASDIEPIRSLYKTHVYQLAKFLNLPEVILTKNPTAGLWENQTDEKEFGFTYKEADQILYYRFDKKLSLQNIIARGLKKATILRVLQFAKRNDFKHKLPFIAEPRIILD